ncbi:hypothetical protein NDU88_004194 [Pleurodeles waltl]|uniref:Uncharacterized protein n=1 Tax=Pleurodeles waltl TaxID=8319 RepID=A0AAV7QBW2_PLEWA|nr:hypothetical protein NDU88_004194 [Pleurodeles waltl]
MQSGRVKWRPCRDAILKSVREQKAERPLGPDTARRDRSAIGAYAGLGITDGGEGKRLRGGLGSNGNPRGDRRRCGGTCGPPFRSLHQREKKRMRLAGPGWGTKQ